MKGFTGFPVHGIIAWLGLVLLPSRVPLRAL